MSSPSPLQTITSLMQKYDAIRETYTTSSFAVEIRKFIISRTWQIDIAVGFGIGSITAERKGFFKDERVEQDICVNLFRLACFMDVVGFLDLLGQGGKVILRDWEFNELDVMVLKGLGVEVVYGDVNVEGETFLFNASLFGAGKSWKGVFEGYIKDSPALYVGRDIGVL
jgi:hypothetical protein